MKKINKILIVRPDAIGDFISVTPVLFALKRENPEIRITVLAGPGNFRLVKDHNLVDEVLLDKVKSGLIGKRGKFSALSDFRAYAREIRNHHFDAALIYHNELPYALLAWLAGIPVRVGDKDKVFLSPFYNGGTHIKNADQSKTVIDYNLQYIRALGYKTDNCPPNLPVMKEDFPLEGEIKIGVHLGHVGGSAAGRKLPAEKYKEALMKIKNDFPQANIILLGTEEMREDAGEIAFHTQATNLVGKTTINQLLSVISKLSVYIGVDTGPTHVAAAYKIPMVFIMAIKSVKPLRWAPVFSPKVIVKLKSKCRFVCKYAGCVEKVCEESISPDEIATGVRTLLSPGYQPKDEYLYSFKNSNNVLFIGNEFKPLAEKLKSEGLGVAFYPKDDFILPRIRRLLSTMLYEDTTILHSSVDDRLLFWLVGMIAPSLLLTPPLIVHTDKKWGSADELINFYLEKFREKSPKN